MHIVNNNLKLHYFEITIYNKGLTNTIAFDSQLLNYF